MLRFSQFQKMLKYNTKMAPEKHDKPTKFAPWGQRGSTISILIDVDQR